MPPEAVEKVERDKIDEERRKHVEAEQERISKESPPPKVEMPARKGDGALTRAGMEAIIKRGESVVHQGTIYSKIDDLPDEATLTEGDARASAAATSAIDAQIAALSSQRAALEKTHAKNVEAEKGKAAAEHKHPEPPRR